MGLKRNGRPKLEAVEVLYVRAPGEELEHAARIQAAALRCVQAMAMDYGRDQVPAEPLAECWAELARELERQPTEAERRVYAHKWRNAVTCAWAGWYG